MIITECSAHHNSEVAIYHGQSSSINSAPLGSTEKWDISQLCGTEGTIDVQVI